MSNINIGDQDLIIRDVPISEIEDFLDPLGFVTRAKYLYMIRTKDGKDVFYKPWEPQQVVDKVIREEVKRSQEVLGRTQVFLMYLKARQEGLSTDTTLRMTDKMLFNESYYSQVLAHDEEGTGILYKQYKRAFNNLPNFVRVVDPDGNPVEMGGSVWMIPIKPEGGPTKKGIEYKNLTESNIIVQTAGKGDSAGKAGSLNAVHYSECANYKEHDEVMSSVNQQLGGTDIFGVKESTANGTTGVGEGFYNDWTAQEKAWIRFKNGENPTFEGWRPLFIPWYWLSKYRRPLYKGKKISLDGIDWKDEKEKQEYLEWEEQVEQEIIPKDPEVDHNSYDVRESTNFYRDVIKNKCQRKLDKARRYYPTTPEEAFVTSDKCFFSTNKLFTVKTNLKAMDVDDINGYKVGYINEKGNFIEKVGGPLKIKRFPESDWENRFIVGCDQSKGYEEGDYSCMPVFDRIERDWPAYWNDQIPENKLAEEYNKMLYFWNNALAIPEDNRMTVINLIKPDGLLRYMGPLYYQRENSTSRSRREPKWGYNMNTSSRKRALDFLYDFLDGEKDFGTVENLGNYETLFTEEMVNEFIHFIRHVRANTTKYEAAQGFKDDIVIGCALTIMGDIWWEKSPRKLSSAKKRQKHKRIKNLSTSSRNRNISQVGTRQSQLGKKRKKGKYRMSVGGPKRQSKLGK